LAEFSFRHRFELKSSNEFSLYFFLLDFRDDICYAGLAAFPRKKEERKRREENRFVHILVLRCNWLFVSRAWSVDRTRCFVIMVVSVSLVRLIVSC
jgi:hypothetical protein